MKKIALMTALALSVIGSVAAWAGGIYPGFPAWTTEVPYSQFTGNEFWPMDTGLPNGVTPQTVYGTLDSIYAGVLVTESDATVPNLTASEVSGAPLIYVRLTGAPSSDQAMTLPLFADVYSRVNAIYGSATNGAVGKCWFVKYVNVGGTSSGTFTITTNTGWTVAGNVAVPVGGSRTHKMCVTSATAGTSTDYGY